MDELSWGMFSLGMAFIIAALVILSQKPSHLTGTHTDEVDEHGNPVLARNKSFSPMLVSGAALEHLKHLARPLHNRIMLLRAFRRAHSMTSISHTTQQSVAPAGVEMFEMKRIGPIVRVKCCRHMSCCWAALVIDLTRGWVALV